MSRASNNEHHLVVTGNLFGYGGRQNEPEDKWETSVHKTPSIIKAQLKKKLNAVLEKFLETTEL